jgi:hypothetical protein
LESHVSRRAARLDALQPDSNIPKPCFTRCIRGTNHSQTHVTLREHNVTAVQSLISLFGGHLNSLQERIYNTGRRVQAFLDTNDSLLNSINKSGMRSELDTVVLALGQSGGQQAAGRVNAIGETAKQRTLRLALRLNHMRPIASVARAKLRTVPNFQSMTMPSPKIRVVSLLTHAHGMAEAAAPYAQVFIDAGLPDDFIAKLTAAADAVKASIDTRAAARGQRSSATGTLTGLENRARLVFRALNDFVVPILVADVAHSGLLAEWKRARRVDARSGPVAGVEQAARAISPTPAPTAPQPPSVPAPVTTAPVGHAAPAAA